MARSGCTSPRTVSMSSLSSGFAACTAISFHISVDLECGLEPLSAEQIVHAHLPLSGCVVDRERNQSGTAPGGCKQIAGVVVDHLAGRVDDVDMNGMRCRR